MCSKALLRILLAGVFAVSGTGCGLHTGEESPQAPPPSYSGNGFNCVGQIPENIEEYIFDRLAGEQVTEFMQCLQKAFVAFAQLTRGRDQSTYTPDEIRRFLETYFIKSHHMSDELLHEFMVLKQTFIGGNTETISRAELYIAVDVLEDLRKEAIRLKPHLKTLNPVLARQQPARDVGQNMREAYVALNESIQVIAKRFQSGQRNYPLSNLHAFVFEFRKFIGWDAHFPSAIPVENWVEFVRIFKELTVSPEETTKIRARDWAPLLQQLAKWYLAYLEFEVGVREQPKLSGVGLQNTLHLAQNVFTLAEDTISRQNDLTVTFKQMMQLLSALKGVRWLPAKWRVESMEGALRSIVNRIFGDPAVTQGLRSGNGLSLRTLTRIKDSFYQWAYIQMNLDAERERGNPMTVHDIDVPVLQPEFVLKGANTTIATITPDWLEFLKVKDRLRPLFAENSPSVTVAPKSKLRGLKVEHGFYNLSVMNLFRSIVSLIYRGYSSDAYRGVTWDSGLRQEEMVKFYEDFREIGVDLGFVDKRNINTGSRVFIEGNLFTYSSDGLSPELSDLRGKMTFSETVELLAFLWSGGNLSGAIYGELKKICANGERDQNNNPKLQRRCVRKALPQMFQAKMDLLPEFLNYYNGLSDLGRTSFAQNMLITAFSPVNSDPDWVEWSEISTVSVVTYYAEAVLTRFDEDEDAALTNPELDKAAEVFRGFIKWLAKEKMDRELSDADAVGVFYYILKYRALPVSTWDHLEVVRISTFGPGDVRLDRGELSMVFRVMISKLQESSTPPPPSLDPDPTKKPCRGMSDALMRPECEGYGQIH